MIPRSPVRTPKVPVNERGPRLVIHERISAKSTNEKRNYLDRQPGRDPTWIGITGFAFICAVLLAWNATHANDAPAPITSLQALEEGVVVEAGRAPDGTILWAKKIDGKTIYFASATVVAD